MISVGLSFEGVAVATGCEADVQDVVVVEVLWICLWVEKGGDQSCC